MTTVETPPDDGSARRPRGRPRRFDRARAVEQAMQLFWEHGYEGASFAALTGAMGLSASSLQNAFGSKEELFAEALRHYGDAVSTWFATTLAAPGPAREAFATLFAAAAAAFTRPDFPVGCMVSLAATQIGPELAPVRALSAAARRGSQRALSDRIRAGIAAGDVAADTDPDALGAFLAAVFRGMAVQARDGATRNDLLSVGRYAMRAWPSPPG